MTAEFVLDDEEVGKLRRKLEAVEKTMAELVANGCPDTVYGDHGPLDGAGKCPWCRRKVGHVMPMPPIDYSLESELVEAYRQFYDPDWGT